MEQALVTMFFPISFGVGYMVTTGVKKVFNKLLPNIKFERSTSQDNTEYDIFDSYLFNPSPAGEEVFPEKNICSQDVYTDCEYDVIDAYLFKPSPAEKESSLAGEDNTVEEMAASENDLSNGSPAEEQTSSSGEKATSEDGSQKERSDQRNDVSDLGEQTSPAGEVCSKRSPPMFSWAGVEFDEDSTPAQVKKASEDFTHEETSIQENKVSDLGEQTSPAGEVCHRRSPPMFSWAGVECDEDSTPAQTKRTSEDWTPENKSVQENKVCDLGEQTSPAGEVCRKRSPPMFSWAVVKYDEGHDDSTPAPTNKASEQFTHDETSVLENKVSSPAGEVCSPPVFSWAGVEYDGQYEDSTPAQTKADLEDWTQTQTDYYDLKKQTSPAGKVFLTWAGVEYDEDDEDFFAPAVTKETMDDCSHDDHSYDVQEHTSPDKEIDCENNTAEFKGSLIILPKAQLEDWTYEARCLLTVPEHKKKTKPKPQARKSSFWPF